MTLLRVVTSDIKVFAGDMNVYINTCNFDQLQDDLDSLCMWAEKWELTFYVDECKIIHYGHVHPSNSIR